MSYDETKPFSSTNMWFEADPRYSINKRSNIVIIRPTVNGKRSGLAHVDTKETWCIFTDFEDHKVISADDKWDIDWIWTWAPK